MLNVTKLNVIMLDFAMKMIVLMRNIFILSVIMLNVAMLSGIIQNAPMMSVYAECCHAKFHYAGSRNKKDCFYAKYCYAQCR
jgi:hypothetical protein